MAAASTDNQAEVSLQTALQGGGDVLGLGPAGQLPVIYSHILQLIQAAAPQQQGHGWQAIIVAPTRDAVRQAAAAADAALKGLSLTVLDSEEALRTKVLQAGQIVLTTPGQLAKAIRAKYMREGAWQAHEGLQRPGLRFLAVLSADLLLSMPGYQEDLTLVLSQRWGAQAGHSENDCKDRAFVPEATQRLLVTRTQGPDTRVLSGEMLRNATAVQLAQATAAPAPAKVLQRFVLPCCSEDRLVVVLALLKSGALKGRGCMFVGHAQSAHRLRMFLDSFGVRAALCHDAMPANAREHALEAYNRGLYDWLILAGQWQKPVKPTAEDRDKEGESDSDPETATRKPQRKRKRSSSDGVTLRNVTCGLAVEPASSAAEDAQHEKLLGRPSGARFLLSLTEASAAAPGSAGALPFTGLPKEAIERLRYRAEDVARTLTATVVRRAQQKELKNALLRSGPLKEYFEAHPEDLAALKRVRHRTAKYDVADRAHLPHMPGYLRKGLRQGAKGPKRSALPPAPGPGGDAPAPPAPASAPTPAIKPFNMVPLARDDDLTEMEKAAVAKAPKRPKKPDGTYLPKRNVRKNKRRK